MRAGLDGVTIWHPPAGGLRIAVAARLGDSRRGGRGEDPPEKRTRSCPLVAGPV